MLATEILAQDHREALRLVEQLGGVRNDEVGNRELFFELESALRLHMREEEEIFYPALAEREEFRDEMKRNVEEHEPVKRNLSRMRELSVTDEAFQSLLTETSSALESHIDKDEGDIFPRSIELLGDDRIRELGNQIDQMKGSTGASRSAVS